MLPESPVKKKTNRGFLVAIASAVTLSFTGIIIRVIFEDYHLPALILAFWRDFFVVICLLVICLIVSPKTLAIKRKDIGLLVGFGVILALFNILWTIAVTLTGAAIATVLVYSSVVFTALLGWLLLGEHLGWVKTVAVLLCLVGCILVSGAAELNKWHTNALGIITGILSGLFYAFYSLMGRRASQRGINPWTSLFYTFVFAAIILLTINLLPVEFASASAVVPLELFYLGEQWHGWGLVLLLAAGPTLLGFGMYNVSLSILPSSTVNLIVNLEPVFTCITAYFLLGERLTGIELIGSGIIFMAIMLIRFQKPKLAS